MTLMKAKKPKHDGNLEMVKQQMIKADSLKFSFNMPRSMHRKFKVKATNEGKEMTDILISAILLYLDE